MRGKITAVTNHGTIVQLLCEATDSESPSLFPINFDWRMFQHFADSVSEMGLSLEGLEVEYDGEVLYLAE